MNNKRSQSKAWISGALAIVGIALLITWMISLTKYGVWVDENAEVGVARPQDFILFGLGALTLVASVFTLFGRRKPRR